MDEVDTDVKGTKLVQKIASLWKRIARSNGRSRYSRLNTPADPSCTCSDSNGGPIGTSSLPNSELNAAQSDPPSSIISSNCFHLMPYRKWHTRRRLPGHLNFIQRKEGKIKGCIDNNNGCPPRDVPKGFVAVYVGDMQEEQTRFVIPVFYLNHPLFLHLLKEAEQVYGFQQKGVFTIPCQVSDFEYLQWLIEKEETRN